MTMGAVKALKQEPLSPELLDTDIDDGLSSATVRPQASMDAFAPGMDTTSTLPFPYMQHLLPVSTLPCYLPGYLPVTHGMGSDAPLTDSTLSQSPPSQEESESWQEFFTSDLEDQEYEVHPNNPNPQVATSFSSEIRLKKYAEMKKRPRKRRRPAPVKEHHNCHGKEVPPKIHPSCPKDDRLILELRWKHRYKCGGHMWQAIQEDYMTGMKHSMAPETLQMKLKRARVKYVQWEDKDEEILREAWETVERDRYNLVLDVFHELGGSRNLRLCPSEVKDKVGKAKLVIPNKPKTSGRMTVQKSTQDVIEKLEHITKKFEEDPVQHLMEDACIQPDLQPA